MIPIYRAKKIDSDDYIEGYLHKVPSLQKESYYITCYWIDNEIGVDNNDFEIDPLTLLISFNNEDWFTMDEIERKVSDSNVLHFIIDTISLHQQ